MDHTVCSPTYQILKRVNLLGPNPMVVLDGCVEWVAVSEREREKESEGCGDELENTTRACMRVSGWPQHAHCTSPETGRFRQIRAHQDLATTGGGGDCETCCVRVIACGQGMRNIEGC